VQTNQDSMMIRDLDRALHNGDRGLSVVYMPTVLLADSSPTGAEALIRWHHCDFGPIAPGKFVPLAEQSGLIGALDTFVRREVFRTAVDGAFVSGRVAVNVSGTELSDPAYADTVLDELANTGLPGERLCVEVTETALLTDPGAASETLTRLRADGVWVALDDFGTGHSTLTYLTTLPCDIIKVDRSFVADLGHDPRAEHVIRAIVGMARGLDMTVVAEGVETTDQRDALMRFGVTEGQGFLFGHPSSVMPTHRATATVRAQGRLRRDSELDPQLLIDLNADLQCATGLDMALTLMLRTLRNLVAFTGASIQLLGGDGIRLAAAYPPPTATARAARIPPGQGVAGAVITSGKMRYLADITVPTAAVPAQQRTDSTSRHTRSYLAVPLYRAGNPVGLLQLDSVEPDAFPPHVALVLATAAASLTDVLERHFVIPE
jgi:EAL domain-containing protein (putative c-di-GMP-specific phosphodiesterase class I)